MLKMTYGIIVDTIQQALLGLEQTLLLLHGLSLIMRGLDGIKYLEE